MFITTFTTVSHMSLFWAGYMYSRPQSYFLKIHFNIVFPSTSNIPKWSRFLSFPHYNPAFTSPLFRPCNMPWDINPVTNIYIYSLTPWCRVLLEKLTGLQIVKKFLAIHGTRTFMTALTSVRHLSLSWASPIQSIYPNPTSWRSILVLSTHLRLGLPSGLFPSGFPSKTLYTPISSPHIFDENSDTKFHTCSRDWRWVATSIERGGH